MTLFHLYLYSAFYKTYHFKAALQLFDCVKVMSIWLICKVLRYSSNISLWDSPIYFYRGKNAGYLCCVFKWRDDKEGDHIYKPTAALQRMLSKRQICPMYQRHRHLPDLWACKICMRELHPLQVQAKLTRWENTGGGPPIRFSGWQYVIYCALYAVTPPPFKIGWVTINLSSHLNSWSSEERQRWECLMKCGTHVQKPMLKINEGRDSLPSGRRLMSDRFLIHPCFLVRRTPSSKPHY